MVIQSYLHEVGKSFEVVYYNADWLKELGLDEPKTPSEFAEAACAATNRLLVAKWEMTASLVMKLILMLVTLLLGYLLMVVMSLIMIAGQYIYNGPKAIEAMEFIQGMANKGCAIVTRGKYTDQQYLGQGSNLFAAYLQLQGLLISKNLLKKVIMVIGMFPICIIQLVSQY